MGKKLLHTFIGVLLFQVAISQCLLLSDLDTCKIYKSISSIKGHENEVYRVDLSKKKRPPERSFELSLRCIKVQ